MPSLTAFGAPSTSAFASPKPRPVIARTSLITLIFLPPSPVRMTSNSVFSSAGAAAAAPPPAAGAAATAAAAETPHFSSSALARSAASRTVSSESWSTSLVMSAIFYSLWAPGPLVSRVDETQVSGGFLGPVSGEDPRQLGAGLADRARDLGRGCLDQADQAGAKLVERGELGQRLDPVHVEQGVAHRPADDLEPVVGLGEIDRDLGRRDRIARGRQRGRALHQVADRLVARVLESDQGKAVLGHFIL